MPEPNRMAVKASELRAAGTRIEKPASTVVKGTSAAKRQGDRQLAVGCHLFAAQLAI